MDIKEAIQHCRDVAGGCPAGDRDCAYQHDQLADWLEELVAYRAAMPLERVQEFLQAEHDGRLVVKPCTPAYLTREEVKAAISKENSSWYDHIKHKK